MHIENIFLLNRSSESVIMQHSVNLTKNCLVTNLDWFFRPSLCLEDISPIDYLEIFAIEENHDKSHLKQNKITKQTHIYNAWNETQNIWIWNNDSLAIHKITQVYFLSFPLIALKFVIPKKFTEAVPQDSPWHLLQASHRLKVTLIRAEAQGRIDFGDCGVEFRNNNQPY